MILTLQQRIAFLVALPVLFFSFFFSAQTSFAACDPGFSNNEGWCYDGSTGAGGWCVVVPCNQAESGSADIVYDRVSGNAQEDPEIYFNEAKTMGVVVDSNFNNEIKVQIDVKNNAGGNTALGKAFDDLFGRLQDFYSNLFRGRIGEAFRSQWGAKSGYVDAPGVPVGEPEDETVGRRRFYYDRVYVDDGCTARRWHWTENLGYQVTASFPCGDEPWLIASGGEGQSPLGEIYAEGVIDDSVDVPSEEARAGQHRYRTIQNEDGCFAQRITLSETGWVITGQYPFEDHPWYFANLNPCAGFAGDDTISPITEKELYCEVNGELSEEMQKASIRSCVEKSELSADEKQAVLNSLQ